MKHIALLAFLLAVSGSPLFAAPAPKKIPTRFWDRTTIALQLVNLGAQSADFITTQQDLHDPALHEANPLMQSLGARVGLKVGVVGLSVGLSYLAYRTHHYRLERIIPIVLAAPSGVAAVHNASLR